MRLRRGGWRRRRIDRAQHLARLRDLDIVETRREAQTIYYSLVEGPAQRIIDTLHGIYCAGERPLCEGT